jgi:hypothetical protein
MSKLSTGSNMVFSDEDIVFDLFISIGVKSDEFKTYFEHDRRVF